MALNLNPTLAATQDSQFRRPILEIITGKLTADIPFLGSRVTDSTSDETKPSLISHSTGRLEALYRTSGHLYLVYTDTGRTTFSYVDLPLGAYTGVVDATLCEIGNGNLGIIFITSTQLCRIVVSATGTVVSAAAVIDTFTSGTVTSPFVCRLANGTFLLVYAFNDSGTYEIDKRTSSADFASWGAASDITPSGLVAGNWKERPSLLQITTGQIWLWFDYLTGVSGDDELVNVYFSTSDDNGGTWSAATKFTDITLYGTGAKHPIAIQNLANTMLLMYYEQVNALHMGDTNDGYCHNSECPIDNSQVTNIGLDSVNRKLYCYCSLAPSGASSFVSLFRVDLATWTIDACWNDTSVPAFNAMICAYGIGSCGSRSWPDGHLFPVFLQGTMDLLDGEADTITTFNFYDYPEYSLTKNVSGGPASGMPINLARVDHATNKLWVVLGDIGFIIGYFDLTEVGETKTFHTVVTDTDLDTFDRIALGGGFGATLQIMESEDLILVGAGDYSYKGWTNLYNISSGGRYRHYDWAGTPGYPYFGLHGAIYYDGAIYGGVQYQALYGEEDHRGLCKIDVATNVCTYFRPPWATLDDYGLTFAALTDDDRIIWTLYEYGVGIFDHAAQAWEPTLFNNDSVPGMDSASEYKFWPVVYDPATNMILIGSIGSDHGAIGFSDAGSFREIMYQEGIYTTSWEWTEKADLVTGLYDFDPVGAYAGDSLYAFWTRENPDDDSMKIFYDKEGSILNLQDFILRREEISIQWGIEGTPNRLQFGVSDGYLFDPHNVASLYNSYLRKGRKLDVRMGEEISGIRYWVNQGVFFVTEFSLIYERGTYPSARIVANDRRCLWEHKQVLATEYYQAAGEEVLEDILEDVCGLASSQYDIPIFDITATIYAQWLEEYGKDIVDQICQRFGYFPYFGMDGKFTCRKISDGNAVAHTYTAETGQIVNFTADDKYSSFVNKVIVTGVERDFIEVIFDEECVGQLAGTLGWWGCKQTHTVYFSLDKSRKCRSPRLKVLESATSIGFKLAGGISESITEVDSEEKYCVVTITAPNLIPQVIALVATVAGLLYFGDAVVKYWTRPVGTALQMIALTALNLTLAAIGNYQYEIWAQPLGTQRRSIQNDENHGQDTDHQTEIGEVILNKSEEALAVTVNQLNDVADHKILIERLQRKRVSLSKIAHLQDEVGDTIRIPHPHTGMNMDIFLAGLIRKMKISEAGKMDGYFIDSIEGWKL